MADADPIFMRRDGTHLSITVRNLLTRQCSKVSQHLPLITCALPPTAVLNLTEAAETQHSRIFCCACACTPLQAGLLTQGVPDQLQMPSAGTKHNFSATARQALLRSFMPMAALSHSNSPLWTDDEKTVSIRVHISTEARAHCACICSAVAAAQHYPRAARQLR